MLREVIQELEELDIPHLFIGSIAMAAALGDKWDTAEDIDILLGKGDAQRALDQFLALGFSTHVRDPEWIYKVARPNVTVDLIFKASEQLMIDDEMMRRAHRARFESMELLIPCSEDFTIMKCLADSLENRGHWYDAIRLLSRCSDWNYLSTRGASLTSMWTMNLCRNCPTLSYQVDALAASGDSG